MANLKSDTTIDGALIYNEGTATASGTTVTVDLSTGSYFEVDFQNVSGTITSFTVNNPHASQVSSFVLKITQGSTARQFNWNSITNVKWPGNQYISWQDSQSGVSVTAESSSGSGTGYTCTITTNTSDNTNLTNVNTSAGSGSGYVFGEKIILRDPGNTSNYAIVTVTQVTGSGGVNNINETSYSALAVTYADTSHFYGSTTNNAVDIYSFTTWDAGTTWYGKIVGQNFLL